MKILDLTMPIDGRTPTFLGDLKQEIRQIATILKNGWNEKRLSISSHFSTHIDAPFHMEENGKKLTDYPIGTFVGDAVVIDARNQQEIGSGLENVRSDDIVFFCTCRTKKAYEKDFFSANPVITNKTAQKLVENKVALDQLIGKRFRCFILPLKIQDADGAPCRVIGIL